MEDFSYPPKIKFIVCQKNVTVKYETITAAIFPFLLICACAEFISKYALTWNYVNMNISIFYRRFHAYS